MEATPLLIHEGCSLVDAAKQLGDSVATTSQTYLHVFEDVEESPR